MLACVQTAFLLEKLQLRQRGGELNAAAESHVKPVGGGADRKAGRPPPAGRGQSGYKHGRVCAA